MLTDKLSLSTNSSVWNDYTLIKLICTCFAFIIALYITFLSYKLRPYSARVNNFVSFMNRRNWFIRTFWKLSSVLVSFLINSGAGLVAHCIALVLPSLIRSVYLSAEILVALADKRILMRCQYLVIGCQILIYHQGQLTNFEFWIWTLNSENKKAFLRAYVLCKQLSS